jgi:hypothetical protein
MMSEIHECIAAFADGEPVDPERLDRALADADGRAYLIDLLVLRGLYGRGDPQPVPATRPRRAFRWLPAVAALVIVSVLGGYLAGRRAGETSMDATRRAADAAGPPRAQTEISVTAPAPTHVIRLEPGVDWKERGGGN